MATRKPRTPLAAIVLAAGKGTRMKSITAKVLHPLGGRPLVWYAVRRALEAGASPVVVVVGHQAAAVEAALRAALPDAPLRFALQADQKGTAHAVLAAKPALRGVTGPIAILSGDVPLLTTATLAAVVKARARARSPLALASMRLAEPRGYGRVLRDGRGRPVRIVEEKDATAAERAVTEVNAGLYCADAAFLWKALARVDARNAQGEFYLTDLVALAARAAPAVAVEVDPQEASGVNDLAELARAGKELQRRRTLALLRAGVTVEDPDRFLCDEGVEVGPDSVIEPDVRLRGATRVGAGCRLGQGVVITDGLLADGVTVRPYTVVEGPATVGSGALLGPFSRIRPGSELGEGVHVGNFVETKKTRLGKGSKANHLAYLGDAVVGAGVNVGAGTITCNYDGEKKHETRIGDGAFIGSDSILVAPIEIGAGAYVAAGSTVTQTVPPGALALGRAQQVNKEGWVARRQAAKAAQAKAAARPGPR
ncbi:MAG: bifunctional UDP-N-acetylglucosamine diphosphorylase/glucosamine-1-phosphate N-acetyltransferase GlmU [Anaeromyxobacter sp.]|nr:bifunctional UDP-N-acetylglucosamine diphosphorylase/glucosamine-1-phosphate N-acetyltransferase GlmU [Anaeromyxobacter sp.]MBL0275097.1 bifunctional UDP-N-acetylglucosamine diphosphorylase/glucosamine-1-phosphate N-acetyltransferase GlmU [Anaeromyxobacter sp.]